VKETKNDINGEGNSDGRISRKASQGEQSEEGKKQGVKRKIIRSGEKVTKGKRNTTTSVDHLNGRSPRFIKSSKKTRSADKKGTTTEMCQSRTGHYEPNAPVNVEERQRRLKKVKSMPT